MSKYTSPMKTLWGKNAGRFIRIPSELLNNHLQLGLSADDLVVIIWIAGHQWNEKPAFPHPAKLARVLGISTSEVESRLFSLRDRGFITLEPTKNGSRNYHQDLRPLRNMLQTLLKSPERIDVSINKSSLNDAYIQKDASIPKRISNRGGTSSLADVLNKRSRSSGEVNE